MKNQEIKYTQNLLLFFLAMTASIATYAQDGGLDIDVNIGEPEWYQQTWVWVVGAAIFVLILVALLRKKK
jgi:phosphoglycerol transferase MdoB-like AlkP superfamily enzyme